MEQEKSLMKEYIYRLGDQHKGNIITLIDTAIRESIGKSDDPEKLRVGACSHQSILERERDAKGKNPERYCRKCGIDVGIVGVGRVNDYLVLRNPYCRSPICLDCVKNGGDVFYHSFRKGVEDYQKTKARTIIDSVFGG